MLSLDSTFWSWMVELLNAFLKFMSCSETVNQRRREFAVTTKSAGINQWMKTRQMASPELTLLHAGVQLGDLDGQAVDSVLK